jgi:hypothetical protein
MQDRKKDILQKAVRKRDNNVTAARYIRQRPVPSREMSRFQLADNAVPSLQITQLQLAALSRQGR